jgi:hypothetical protein
MVGFLGDVIVAAIEKNLSDLTGKAGSHGRDGGVMIDNQSRLRRETVRTVGRRVAVRAGPHLPIGEPMRWMNL